MEGSKEFLYIKKINPPKTAIELLDLTYFFPLPAVWGLKKRMKIWMYVHFPHSSQFHWSHPRGYQSLGLEER